MKIGILECDDVQEPLQETFGSFPEMFIQLLESVSDNITWQIYQVRNQQYPASPQACDAYICTGSRCGVYEDLQWLTALEDFTRQVAQTNIPFIGVCFGHQMLAQALGGKVEQSDKGWGIGVSFNQVQRQMPWMQPASEQLDLVVSHQDQVVALPENTQVLASSNFCPNYMIQIGENMLGIQGHPEFCKAFSKALINARLDRLPAQRVREARASLNAAIDDQLAARWMINFLSQ